MNSLSERQRCVIEGLLLVLILLLAFFMAYIPHLDYIYPIHIDEWWRYGDAQSLIETGHIPYPDPFSSGETLYEDIEVGYHLLIGVIKVVTDISWLSLFRFLPGIIFALLVFQAYAFGKGRGFGLGAAFLVSLIPTTVRFLGPAFLVPVSFGLVFVPLTLYVLHRLMLDMRGSVILFLISLSLLFIHPPTLVVVTGIIVVHLVFLQFDKEKARKRMRYTILLLTSIIPIYILMLVWAPTWVDFVVSETISPELHLQLPPIQDALPKYGYIPAALFVLGALTIIYKKRDYLALVILAISLLAFLQIYAWFYVGLDILYERGWLYLYVLMALLGAIALKEIWGWIMISLKNCPKIANIVSYTVVSVLVIISFVMSLNSHLSEPYYHVIDDRAYQDFLWVNKYVPQKYQIGILDTHQAWAFAAISGKFAYTAEISPNFHAMGRSAMEFLEGGAKDTSWLEERGITIVYTAEPVDNAKLIKVSNNTYLLNK